MLNWNSYDYNAECIVSLKKSTVPFSKIVVVDNASADGSIEKLVARFEKDDQVQFIRNPDNYGFARGMNIGIRHALGQGASGVFLINNDTIVDPSCLGSLLSGLAGVPCAGMAGPTILFHSKPEKIWQSGGYFNKLRAGVVIPYKGKDVGTISPEIKEVTFLTGCALLIKRDVFDLAGFLDTDYFFYGEDVDFALRALSKNVKLIYVPEARVWHKIEDVATDRTSSHVLYHLARSTALIIRKHFSLPYVLYGMALQVVVYTPYRLLQIIRGGAPVSSLSAWLKGLADGVLLRRA
jgi:GT2 family glycosyltransferase